MAKIKRSRKVQWAVGMLTSTERRISALVLQTEQQSFLNKIAGKHGERGIFLDRNVIIAGIV